MQGAQVWSAGQGAEIPYAKQPKKKKKRKTQQHKTNKPPLQTQPTHGGLSLWAPELSLTSKSRDSFLGPTTRWQEVISAAQRTPGHWARNSFDPKWSPEGAATVELLEERTSLALELTALDREAYLSPLSCNFLSPVCVLDSLPACLSACPVHCHKNTQNRLSAKFLDFGDKWWIRLRFFLKRACHLTGKSSTWYFYRVVYGDLGVYKVTQKRQGALGWAWASGKASWRRRYLKWVQKIVFRWREMEKVCQAAQPTWVKAQTCEPPWCVQKDRGSGRWLCAPSKWNKERWAGGEGSRVKSGGFCRVLQAKVGAWIFSCGEWELR